jgi:hypothetical protein
MGNDNFTTPPQLPNEFEMLHILHGDANAKANIVAGILDAVKAKKVPLTVDEAEALRQYKFTFERAIDRVHGHINQCNEGQPEGRLA